MLQVHFAFGHSTSASGPNRRVPPPRGSSSQAPLGHPLLPALALLASSLLRGVSSRRGAPPADPRFLWVRSPFFGFYVILLEIARARVLPVRGRTDVFSRPRRQVSSGIAFGISSLLTRCSAKFFPIGAAGRVFPVATEYNFESTAA